MFRPGIAGMNMNIPAECRGSHASPDEAAARARNLNPFGAPISTCKQRPRVVRLVTCPPLELLVGVTEFG